MKRRMCSLFAISILLTSPEMFSQSYIPLPDSNAIWSVRQFKTFRYFAKGDSVFNNIKYRKYYSSSDTLASITTFTFAALVRQDTSAKRVYGLFPGKTSEALLYDFSLSANSTATVYSRFKDLDSKFGGGFIGIYVYKIDTIMLLDNKPRRMLWVQNSPQNNMFKDNWIEGIGSLSGLFDPGLEATVNFADIDYCWPKLLCYNENQMKLYGAFNGTSPCTATCEVHGTGIGQESLNVLPVQVFPNPVTDRLNIHFKDQATGRNFDLRLSDLAGRLVFSQKTSAQEATIEMSHIENGVYFLEIRDASQRFSTHKILKQ